MTPKNTRFTNMENQIFSRHFSPKTQKNSRASRRGSAIIGTKNVFASKTYIFFKFALKFNKMTSYMSGIFYSLLIMHLCRTFTKSFCMCFELNFQNHPFDAQTLRFQCLYHPFSFFTTATLNPNR